MFNCMEEKDGKFYPCFYGYKTKFRLIWPPEKHKEFYLSPRLSPNYRSSQVDFDNPDFEKHSNFSLDGVMEVLYKGKNFFQ